MDLRSAEVARHTRPKFITWTADPVYQTQKLTVRDNPVIINSATASGTITLPDISEAAEFGRPLTILCHTAGNATVVQDDDDSIDWTDFTGAGTGKQLDAALDSITLQPAGRKWSILLNDVA